jgi:hypothetical protein
MNHLSAALVNRRNYLIKLALNSPLDRGQYTAKVLEQNPGKEKLHGDWSPTSANASFTGDLGSDNSLLNKLLRIRRVTGAEYKTGKDGVITETMGGRQYVEPTGLGYGASVVGGGGLGAGIGALISDDKKLGAITGGVLGAVAAPLALLAASRAGMIMPSKGGSLPSAKIEYTPVKTPPAK